MPGMENLYVATSFHLTCTTVPVLTEMMAQMMLGEPVEPSLDSFSPARFGTQ
jgi:glycine/D-amino acid oxidase-like deaminating enzyme